MALARFRMLNNDLINKDPNVVPEKALLVILDSKSDVCMAKDFKDNKHTRHISRRIHFIINGGECNMHKTLWCEVGMQLPDIVTKNVREK